jgi:hypothetical protein
MNTPAGFLIPYFQLLVGKMIDSLNTGTSIVDAVTEIAIMFGYLSIAAFFAGALQGTPDRHHNQVNIMTYQRAARM